MDLRTGGRGGHPGDVLKDVGKGSEGEKVDWEEGKEDLEETGKLEQEGPPETVPLGVRVKAGAKVGNYGDAANLAKAVLDYPVDGGGEGERASRQTKATEEALCGEDADGTAGGGMEKVPGGEGEVVGMDSLGEAFGEEEGAGTVANPRPDKAPRDGTAGCVNNFGDSAAAGWTTPPLGRVLGDALEDYFGAGRKGRRRSLHPSRRDTECLAWRFSVV